MILYCFPVNTGRKLNVHNVRIELNELYEYGVSLHIPSKCGEIRTRKNSVFGYFSRSGER